MTTNAPEHRDPGPLDYARPRAAARDFPIALVVGLCLGPLAIWGLSVLQTIPYRPPDDMSTLLDGRQIVAAQVLQAAIAVLWTLGVIMLLRKLRRR